MLLLERNKGVWRRESVRKMKSDFWTVPLLRPWRIARAPLLVVVVHNHSSAARPPQRDGRRLVCSTSFSDRCAFRGDVVLLDISGLGSSSRCLFVSRKSGDEATYYSYVCRDGLIMRSRFTAVDCKRKRRDSEVLILGRDATTIQGYDVIVHIITCGQPGGREETCSRTLC